MTYSGKFYYGGGVWLDTLAFIAASDDDRKIILRIAADRAVRENPHIVKDEILNSFATIVEPVDGV